LCSLDLHQENEFIELISFIELTNLLYLHTNRIFECVNLA
jgi:hypothetical protein